MIEKWRQNNDLFRWRHAKYRTTDAQEWEKQELRRLGFKVYAPHDDKDINDKANANQDKLAERIVFNDTLGMETSDVMIFDYLPHAQGTICELGYAQHLKRK